MHIFLCGYQQTGKSTLIRRALAELNLLPSGFVTVARPFDQERISEVYIKAFGDQDDCWHEQNLIGRRYQKGMWQAFPQTFDRVGVEILEQAQAPLIVMDELGFMEKDALVFQQKVLQLLDGEIPVLGVVKPQALPFLEKIRAHPKVRVLEITVENREYRYKGLTQLLREQIK